MKRADIRPAVASDYAALFGKSPEFTFKGVTAYRDGVPVAMAGVYFNGAPIVFAHTTPKAAPRDVLLGAKRLLAEVTLRPLYAVRDCGIATSDGFLRHFNFDFLREEDGKEIYVCG